MTAFNLIPTVEQSGFDDPVLSPVAATLVTARAVQTHADRLGEVAYDPEVVDEALRYISDVAWYAVVNSMPSMGSSQAIEQQLQNRAALAH